MIRINRYYELNTGTQILISTSYLDFYSVANKCPIVLYKAVAEQDSTGGFVWSKSLAAQTGITSQNCYAVVSTSTAFSALTNFRIGCQTTYYNGPQWLINKYPIASNGLVYSNNFKIAIIEFCGSNSYIDQLQISNTYGQNPLILQNVATYVVIDISKIFYFFDPNCANNKITSCVITSFGGITGTKVAGSTWQFLISSLTSGTLNSTIKCYSSLSASAIESVNQSFIITPGCNFDFSLIILNQIVDINSPTSNAYTLISPTLSCISDTAGSHSVLNINNLGRIPSDTGIKMSSSCSSQPCLFFDLDSTSFAQKIQFQIQTCTASKSICTNSPIITIVVKCSSSQISWSQSSDLQTYQTWEINNTQPYFWFREQNINNINCGCSYSVKANQVDTDVSPTNMVSSIYPFSGYQTATDGLYQIQVVPSYTNVEAVYTFYLLTSCYGGNNYWAQDTLTNSAKMTLKIYCGSSSSSIAQTTNYYQVSLTDVQYVDKNNETTKFILPQFIDIVYCTNPLILISSKYEVSTINIEVIHPSSNFVQDPTDFTLDNDYQQVVPQNINVDATYQFYVKVSQTEGKILYSSLMTLVVGCQSTGTNWTDSVNNDKFITNAKTNLKAYMFNPPTIQSYYCVIGSHSVVNVKNNNKTHPTQGIQRSSTCQEEICFDLDLFSIDYNQTIQFQIQTCSTFGNVCHNSQVITIKVIEENNPPQLKSKSQEVSFQIIIDIGSKQITPINLPQTTDKDGDTVTMSFTNLPNYVTYDKDSSLLYFDSEQFSKQDYQNLKGNLKLKGLLNDSKNGTSSFIFKIQINNRPQFVSGLQELTTELNIVPGSKHVIPIYLPKTQDQDDDLVTISFTSLPNYITFDNLRGQLNFIQSKFTSQEFQNIKGNLVLQGVLTDQRNGKNNFAYNIKLVDDVGQALKNIKVNKTSKPIQMKITKIDQSGVVIVEYSEDLISLYDRNDSRLNLTSISNQNFMIVQYETLYSSIKDSKESLTNYQTQVLPKLESWKFEEFTNKEFKIKLNFSNPLFVSQSDIGKDSIVFTIMKPELFQSKYTMQILEENYTLTGEIPIQMQSQGDFQQKQNIVNTGNNGLRATMFIPILFQIFLSFTMDILWSMIAAMQLVSNIKNLTNLTLPGQVTLLMTVIDQTVNFNILAIPFVQNFMQSVSGTLYDFIESQGELLVASVGISILVILLGLGTLFLDKVNTKNPQFLSDLKAKLMWGAVLRPIHQGYFRQILKTFQDIKQFKGDNHQQLYIPLIKLIIFAFFPIIVTYYLFKKKNQLQNPEIMKKYGALYSNLRVHWSKDFPTYNPNEIFDQNQLNQQKSQKSNAIDEDLEKEGGIRDKVKFQSELEIIMKNHFSFADEGQKEQKKEDSILSEEDKVHMLTVKTIYGSMPDIIAERNLIKNYPQLLHPFMYMTIRIIVAILTVFAQNYTCIQVVFGYIFMALLQAMFLLYVKPFYDQNVLGRLEIFNSQYLLITSYFLIMFTDFVINPIVKSQIGEFYFWLSIIIISINVLITLFVLLRDPFIYIKSRWIRWQEKKARHELIKQQKELEKVILKQQEKQNKNKMSNENKLLKLRSLNQIIDTKQFQENLEKQKDLPKEVSFGDQIQLKIKKNQSVVNSLQIPSNFQQQSSTSSFNNEYRVVQNFSQDNKNKTDSQQLNETQMKNHSPLYVLMFQRQFQKQRQGDSGQEKQNNVKKSNVFQQLVEKEQKSFQDYFSKRFYVSQKQNQSLTGQESYSQEQNKQILSQNIKNQSKTSKESNFIPIQIKQGFNTYQNLLESVIKIDEQDYLDKKNIKITMNKIEQMNKQNQQEELMEQLKQKVRQNIEEYDFIKPAYRRHIFEAYFKPSMEINFQKIKRNYLCKTKNSRGQFLLTDFEAQNCLKKFKFMFPQTDVKNFDELMDYLHFKENVAQKLEEKEFSKFCLQEQSYQIRNDKRREIKFRSEVRKLNFLEQIGYPVERSYSQV